MIVDPDLPDWEKARVELQGAIDTFNTKLVATQRSLDELEAWLKLITGIAVAMIVVLVLLLTTK